MTSRARPPSSPSPDAPPDDRGGSPVPTDRTTARRADYVAFLFRAPYALDAHELGFVTGVREDCGTQDDPYDSLDVPVQMLDNDFRNPDLGRYVERCARYRPRIGVIGDVQTAGEARKMVGAARRLQAHFENFQPVIVPKSGVALQAIPTDIVVGYPIGYSDITAPDFSRPRDWKGHRIHLLGGTPTRQWTAIKRLTNTTEAETTLATFGDDEPDPFADIVGLDWNGLYKVALKGKYWHHESPHWRCANDLTIRATVRRGLEHVRRFWRERGVWPETQLAPDCTVRSEPPAPDVAICHGCGHDIGRSGSEAGATDPLVQEYEDGTILQYCSERCRDRVEYRDGPIPLSHDRRGQRLGGYYEERRRAAWFDPQ